MLVTTSRDPSSRLTAFAKELKLIFPNAQRINRGGQARSPADGWLRGRPRGPPLCSHAAPLPTRPRLPRSGGTDARLALRFASLPGDEQSPCRHR